MSSGTTRAGTVVVQAVTLGMIATVMSVSMLMNWRTYE